MAKVLNFLLGVMTGAVVGGVIGTLLAPSSGIDLRGQMKGYVESVQDEVKQARSSKREELEQQLSHLRKPTA
jgi:gas vesicle protein